VQFIRIGQRQVREFFATFQDARELRVNEKISFYEPCEVLFWVKKKKENLLYAVRYGGRFAGFVFAKIMSPHWALIDTFYVKPDMRKFGIGRFMQEKIDCLIAREGIKYVSRVTKSESMKKFLAKTGYHQRDEYTWFDKFL
jgi:GNAT superfamily N-acetyltransferase